MTTTHAAPKHYTYATAAEQARLVAAALDFSVAATRDEIESIRAELLALTVGARPRRTLMGRLSRLTRSRPTSARLTASETAGDRR